VASIDVVIVNWNSGDLLARCLASVDRYGASYVHSLVVVDNASEDRSGGDARTFKATSSRYRCILNATNRGFAAACNAGARDCQAEFILFLNPDCEVFADTFDNLMAAVRTSDSSYAAFGAQLVGRDRAVARTCARQPKARHFWVKVLGLDRLSASRIHSHIMAEWPHGETRDVEHVIGAFYLVRTAVFRALGGFDERFFVYLEDLDLSRRILHCGHRIRYLSGVRAFHEGGGTSKNVKALRLYHSLRSRLLFGFKHFSAPAAWALLAGTVLLEPFVRLAYAMLRLEFAAASETVQGYRLLWTDLPGLLAARCLAQ